ncbi:uncharacterized protein LOC125480894 [Pyrus x bretschneideri]|uniref:uncharacterized protein LOC125480894 n=1 Tax=Pyrus x bretschneideri TaxID=225117 RepID=UPI00202EA577|nr:uncharacterized protein LOC125480894 [Pyrus x bretschneideri]
MNSAKCAFGLSANNFLGFLVHYPGIKVDKNKARAIIDAPPSTTKKQLQSLLGKINFLRHFIANSMGKMKVFSTLLKVMDSDTFEWREEHQDAFTQIKVSLHNPTRTCASSVQQASQVVYFDGRGIHWLSSRTRQQYRE